MDMWLYYVKFKSSKIINLLISVFNLQSAIISAQMSLFRSRATPFFYGGCWLGVWSVIRSVGCPKMRRVQFRRWLLMLGLRSESAQQRHVVGALLNNSGCYAFPKKCSTVKNWSIYTNNWNNRKVRDKHHVSWNYSENQSSVPNMKMNAGQMY